MNTLPGANPTRSWADLQADMNAWQDQRAMAQQLMGAGYVPNSGGLGAIAQIFSAFAGNKMSKESDKKLADLLKEEYTFKQADSAAQREQQLAEEERKYNQEVKLFGEKERIKRENTPVDAYANYLASLSPEQRNQAFAVKAGLSARPGSGTNVTVKAPENDVMAAVNAGYVSPEEARRIVREKLGADLPLKDRTARDDQMKGAFDRATLGVSVIDQLIDHPGLETAVGLRGQVDPRNYVWGTEAQGARALIDQLQGQTFLQAFESLKGGGQITQVEGEKAQNAIARLQRSQNPEDFRRALGELRGVMANAQRRAGSGVLPQGQAPGDIIPDSQTGAIPKRGDVVDGYRYKGGDPSNPSSWERI